MESVGRRRAGLAGDSRDSPLTLRRVERQQALIERLHAAHGRRLAFASLARQTGVSVRTVARDVERLRLSGVPLQVRQGRGGGVSLSVTDRPAAVDLDLTEIAALLSSLTSLGPSVSESAGSAMRKLSSAIVGTAAPDPGDLIRRHRMPAGTVVDVLDALQTAGVDSCVGGGWAVDALVGRQTRDHADLDLWVAADQFDALIAVLGARGVDRVLPWGGDRPWNLVLHDGERTRIDLHLYEPKPEGRQWHYGSLLGGEWLPAEALAGQGLIAGRPVRCESADWALRWHTGYPPREVDRHDVAALCAAFGFPRPDGL